MFAKLLAHMTGAPPPRPEDHARDPRWEGWVRKFLKGKVCASCGTTDNLEGHHEIPFHLDRSKEMDPNNVVPLCMKPGHWCHFVFGHRWNWSNYVPNLRALLTWWRGQDQLVKRAG